MSRKIVVLSSGGLDSTTCVGIAVKEVGAENVSTVSIYYGQRHERELKSARDVAVFYNVPHYEVDLSAAFQFSDCNLLAKNDDTIPDKSYNDQIKENGEGKVSTFVPFRNGLLLSAAASIADSLYPGEEVSIYYGAHADDMCGSAYADCSPEFANAMDKAINIGTYGKIHVVGPLVNMNKAEVVKTGLELGVPYDRTWSCYRGGDKQCGHCGTCIDRKRAFEANGVEDPVGYAEE